MSENILHLCYRHALSATMPGCTSVLIDNNLYWPICGRPPILTNCLRRRGGRICKDCKRAKKLGRDHAKPEMYRTTTGG